MCLCSSSGGFTVYRGNYKRWVNIVIINYIINNNVPICTYNSVGVHVEINE